LHLAYKKRIYLLVNFMQRENANLLSEILLALFVQDVHISDRNLTGNVYVA